MWISGFFFVVVIFLCCEDFCGAGRIWCLQSIGVMLFWAMLGYAVLCSTMYATFLGDFEVRFDGVDVLARLDLMYSLYHKSIGMLWFVRVVNRVVVVMSGAI